MARGAVTRQRGKRQGASGKKNNVFTAPTPPPQQLQPSAPPQQHTTQQHVPQQHTPQYTPQSETRPVTHDVPHRHAPEVQQPPRAEEKPARPFIENYELPPTYNSTNVTLIPRDPYWIYAYWDVAQKSVEDLKNRVGANLDGARQVLRMYDISLVDFNGNNANTSFDIEVGPNASTWYISLWNDSSSYCADLGMRMSDGQFLPLARSNFVTTPRAGMSPRSEQIWMEIKDNATKAPFVIGQIRKGDRRAQKKAGDPTKIKRSRRISLSEDDIRSYYSKLSPLLRDVISKKLATQHDNKKSGSGRVVVDIRGRRIALEDFLINGLSKGQFMKRLLSGASEELLFVEGGSESVTSRGGASEQSLGEAKRRAFFFELGTELIVYGRTEPDADVWFEGRKIPLRSDGTFSLRFALPEGKIPLDFVAVSHDKVEKREISTAVERTKTRYSS